jgi:precorrin-2/cobalt-factor-2 C20-methyltransferase
MLCEGDPFFYSSFMYIFSRLAGKFATAVVPGVSSITACAARIGRPLAARNEVLRVVPATLEAERLREELASCESAAIIKVGRHFAKVRDVLSDLGLTANAIAVDKATREGERIAPVADIDADSMPYFATILVYAGKERW